MEAHLTIPVLDASYQSLQIAAAGPIEACLERVAEYRAQGAEVPIIVPNVVNDNYLVTVKKTITAFSAAI